MKQRDFFYGAVLIAFTLLVFWPVIQFDFVNFDDIPYLVDNPHLKYGLTADGIKWAFALPSIQRGPELSPFWRPIAYLSHMLDMQFYGTKAGGHHATNLFLHLLATLLLFTFLLRATSARWKSLLISAFFAVHPLQAESVAWVSARNNELSSIFIFLSLLFYVSHAKKKSAANLLLSTICFALSLMSKPAMLGLPIILLCLDRWPLERILVWQDTKKWIALAFEKWMFFGLSLLFAALTFLSQPGVLKAQTHGGLMLQNAALSGFFYLSKFFWPTLLTVYTPWPPTDFFYQTLGAGAVLLFVSAFIFWRREKFPALLTGWMWYATALLPAAILPAPADRYVYLPIIGILIVVVWGVAGRSSSSTFHKISKALLISGFSGLLLLAAIASRKQIFYWKDGTSLYEHMLAIKPSHYFAHVSLANQLGENGKFEEAAKHYAEAIRIAPNQDSAYRNLGVLMMKMGRMEKAKTAFQKTASLKPADWYPRFVLGLLAQKEKDLESAAKYYLQAITVQPDAWRPYHNLGAVLAAAGDDEKAIICYRKTLELNTNNPTAHLALAKILERKGLATEAKIHTDIAATLLKNSTSGKKKQSAPSNSAEPNGLT